MKADTDAVVTKYETVTALTGKVFTVVADAGAALPYAVLFPTDGVDTQERVTGPRVTRHPRFTVHIVGESAAQVQTIADLVKAVFIQNGRGITLSVSGWVNQPVWYESPLPLQVQESPLPAVVYHVAELGWRSDPSLTP